MAVHIILARRVLILISFLLLLTLGGVVALVYFPKATITIHPAAEHRTVSQLITLSTAAQQPDFTHFTLPAQVVSKEVEQTQTIQRTDSAVQDGLATGTVTLQNNQGEVQSLLPKTHLKYVDTGAFFLTDTPVKIPPQGSVTVNVTAQDKGAVGNVPPGKFVIDKLPAALQNQIFGTSDTAFSGGTIVQNPLSQSEIDKAVQPLVAAVNAQALGQLTAAAGGARVDPSLSTMQTEVQDVSAQAGSKTSAFTVHIKVKASAFIVDDNDLLSLTLLSLRSQSTAGADFVSYDPHSFGVAIKAADFAKGQAQVKGTLTGTFAHTVALGSIQTDQLAGLSASEIKDTLGKIAGIGGVDVSFWPFWVKTAPSRSGSITVNIASAQQ